MFLQVCVASNMLCFLHNSLLDFNSALKENNILQGSSFPADSLHNPPLETTHTLRKTISWSF